MRSIRLHDGLLCLLLASAACATSSRTVASARHNMIIAEEIRATGAVNLYEAIERLRPTFFMTRGYTSFIAEPANAIVVVVNRQIQGGLTELRSISAAGVRSVRRLSAADVYQLTGRSAPSGGIEVVFGP